MRWQIGFNSAFKGLITYFELGFVNFVLLFYVFMLYT